MFRNPISIAERWHYISSRNSKNNNEYTAHFQHSLYLLHTFAFQESRPLLFDCLTTTKQIDWTKRVCITCVHEYFEDTVRNAIDHLSKKIGIKIANNGPSSFYFKCKEACIDVQIE